MATVTDGFADLQRAIDTVASEKAGLDASYEQARQELEGQFQFSETPEEAAQLQSLLDRLAQQKLASEAALSVGYEQARQNVLGRLEQSTGAGLDELSQLTDMFEQSYAQAAEPQGRERYERQGRPTGGAPDSGIARHIASQGADFAAYSQGRQQSSQEDMAWLADTLQAERGAQVGDLSRLAMQLGGNAEAQHRRDVNDRVNSERMTWANLLSGLQGDFRGRDWSLGDSERDLMAALGGMRQSAGENAAQRAQTAALAAARGGSGGGGGRRGGGGSGGGSGSGLPNVIGVDPAAAAQAALAARDARSSALTAANRLLNSPDPVRRDRNAGRAAGGGFGTGGGGGSVLRAR